MKKPSENDKKKIIDDLEEVVSIATQNSNGNTTHSNNNGNGGTGNNKEVRNGTTSSSKNKPIIIGPYKDWISLPNIRVKDFINTGVCEKLYGPKGVESEKLAHHKTAAFAKTISTYPKGLGEPICDYYAVELYEKRTLLSIADGCGWGSAALQAAIRATEAYMDYLRESQKDIFDVKEAGRLILRAFQKAHIKILEGYEDVWDAGTTTLCGGILMELADEIDPELMENFNNMHLESDKSSKNYNFIKDKSSKTFSVKLEKWVDQIPDQELDNYKKGVTQIPPYKCVFICASVGDCKAFHYSSVFHKFTDVTAGNRTNLTDAKDPGGRLGPDQENTGGADLRNLALYLIPCHEEDFIILVSDGIHDNLDPQTIGYSPFDIGLETDKVDTDGPLHIKVWGEMERRNGEQTDVFKNDFRIQYLKAILDNRSKNNSATNGTSKHVYTGGEVVEELIEHSIETTLSSRQFMFSYPTRKLPEDYSLYPGKMDHTTCLCVRANGIMEPRKQPYNNANNNNANNAPNSIYVRIPKSLMETPPNENGAGPGASKNTAVSIGQRTYNTLPKSAVGVQPTTNGGLVGGGGATGPTSTGTSLEDNKKRSIRVYGMDKEPLMELIVGDNDTIMDVIDQIRDHLEAMIHGRPFRLRKGDEAFMRKAVPITRKFFGSKALDYFAGDDVIVLQFGENSKPKEG